MVAFCGFFLISWLVWWFGFFCRGTCLVGFVVRFPKELQTQRKSKTDYQYKECKRTSQVHQEYQPHFVLLQ